MTNTAEEYLLQCVPYHTALRAVRNLLYTTVYCLQTGSVPAMLKRRKSIGPMRHCMQAPILHSTVVLSSFRESSREFPASRDPLRAFLQKVARYPGLFLHDCPVTDRGHSREDNSRTASGTLLQPSLSLCPSFQCYLSPPQVVFECGGRIWSSEARH